MSTLLDKQSILGVDDLERKELDVPEWGGKVFIRTMLAGERDKFEASFRADPHTDLRARIAVLAVCDADGNRLFDDRDVPALTRKSAKALDRVFAVATRLSGVTKEDVEELKKNSSETPSSDSSTG